MPNITTKIATAVAAADREGARRAPGRMVAGLARLMATIVG